jgi:hypothetical protein
MNNNNLPEGQSICKHCGKRSEVAAKQKDGLCLSCVVDKGELQARGGDFYEYDIYLNECLKHRFIEYSEVCVSCNAVRHVYGGTVGAESVEEAQGNLFRMFNIEHPKDYGCRSLSVSDVFSIDGVFYSIQSIGCGVINRPANIIERT